jgi:hypothetical protein
VSDEGGVELMVVVQGRKDERFLFKLRLVKALWRKESERRVATAEEQRPELKTFAATNQKHQTED